MTPRPRPSRPPMRPKPLNNPKASQKWEAFFSAKRIVIVGANGAGKSTLALNLGAMLELPVLHNDGFALTTKWQHRPSAQTASLREAALAEPSWMLEGGPSILNDQTLERCDLIIWLDPSDMLRVWRIAKRSVMMTGRVRPEHPPGNREWPGRRQTSFILGAWRKRHAARAVISGTLATFDGPVIHAKTSEDLARLMQAARKGAKAL